MKKDSVLGIDIAKASFDVVLLSKGKQHWHHFSNSNKGFKSLVAWTKSKGCTDFHACMEATGSYGLGLANFLFENGFKVSIVNPAQIKGFAQSQLTRTKTDKTDAHLIAKFCELFAPRLYEPKPEVYRELQEFVQRVESLTAMKQQENNRLAVASKELTPLILINIEHLENQIKQVEKILKEKIKINPDLEKRAKLLETIPGVSNKTIGVYLAHLGHLNFDSSKKLTAYFGLNPKHKQSGTSIKGSSRISKTGSARLRKSLYMPALVAMRYNPIISGFCERLALKGKSKKLIIIAAMRKLLELIYGVLKSQKGFDPRYKNA